MILKIIHIILLLLLFLVYSFGYAKDEDQDKAKGDRASYLKKAAKISEQAVFRVQNRTFFLSDIGSYIKNIQNLRCLYPESLLLKGTGLLGDPLPNFAQYKGIVPNLSQYIKVFDKLVNLFKIQEFVSLSNIESGVGLLNSFKDQLCIKSDWSGWATDLKALVKAELFVRERFNSKNINLFTSVINKKIQHEFFIKFN